MPIPTPSPASTKSHKNSVHSVIIALAILNAVGLLGMFFKLDMIANDQKMSDKQISECALTKEWYKECKVSLMEIQEEAMKPTENAEIQSSIMKKAFSDFMNVTLKEGETLRLSAPEDELGSYFFLTVTEIDRGGAGGLGATVTASDNGEAKATYLEQGKNWEASTRFAVTVKKLDDSSITLEIGRNDNSPLNP